MSHGSQTCAVFSKPSGKTAVSLQNGRFNGAFGVGNGTEKRGLSKNVNGSLKSFDLSETKSNLAFDKLIPHYKFVRKC